MFACVMTRLCDARHTLKNAFAYQTRVTLAGKASWRPAVPRDRRRVVVRRSGGSSKARGGGSGEAAPHDGTRPHQQQQPYQNPQQQPYHHIPPQQQAAKRPAAAAGDGGLVGKVRALVRRHGAGAAFAYLTVSNLASVFTLAAAWLLFTRATGASPLSRGAWPKFAAAFAPAYLAVQASRPARLAAGVALAPAGEWVLARARSALRLRGRGAALAAALAIEAALLLMVLGLMAAATSGGSGGGGGGALAAFAK